MWVCFYKLQAEDKQCLTSLRQEPSLAHDDHESEVGRFSDRHGEPSQGMQSYSESPSPTTPTELKAPQHELSQHSCALGQGTSQASEPKK